MITLRRIGLAIGAIAIAVGLATGVYVAAQDTGAPHGPFSGRRGPGGFWGLGPDGMMDALGPMIAERLNLTDAQKDQLKGIMDAHRDEMKGLGDRGRQARRALQAAVTAEVLDEGLIRTRAAELATIESDLAVARARIRGEVFRILTPEQQTQAKAAQSRMQERMDRWQDRGAQRPPRAR